MIIYDEVPVTQKEMELDLAAAQHLTQELAKIYGRLPYGKLVLKKGVYEPWGESYITVPQTSIPLDLCERDDRGNLLYCSFAFHELGHYFTWNLLRTDDLWFNEGLSGIAGRADVLPGSALDLESFDMVAHDNWVYTRSPEDAARDNYDKLKRKKNIFKIRECTGGKRNEEGETVTITWDCIGWLSAHRAGYMFFYALAKDYGINGSRIGEFVRSLVELAEDGRRIGTDDLRTAALRVSGKDISPLLDLLEPAIIFNGYGEDGRDIDFIKRHPEYASDETSWID